MSSSLASGTHFSPRRRTAVVLTGEGAHAAYLAGVMSALDAAGVRIDVVLGRGAGALVAAFSALHAEEKIVGEGGILDAFSRRRPYRVAFLYRLAAVCLMAAFAFIASPAIVGLVSVAALPIQAVIRGLVSEGSRSSSSWTSNLVTAMEPYYFPAVALPVIVLFTVVAGRALLLMWKRRGQRPALGEWLPPFFDLAPLESLLEGRLWQLVRGTATEERPRDRRALSDAYTQLLVSGLGQHGFRELVFYALDADTGEEVPFVVLKDRFAKKMAALADPSRSEPIDLANEGSSSLLFDALVAASSPPGLVPEVGLKLPRGTRFGGEVHRFTSSLSMGGNTIPDAVAIGAEQIVYVTAATRGERLSGVLSERLAARALRRSLENDLGWAAERPELRVFVVRPDTERLNPFELSGRPQLGGERLAPAALADQGERDVERLFLRPVLGEELSSFPQEATVPFDRGWEGGPKEL
ncbi:MAG: hypothetical protein ACRD3V_11335 [Vicinamibacteria bacterium]